MKILNGLLFFLLSLTISNSCKKDPEIDIYYYKYSNKYIRDTVTVEMRKGTIGEHHSFVINEKYLDDSEINDRISSIKKEDIISVSFISKADFIEGGYPEDKDGVVKINYYADVLLKPEYYNIENPLVLRFLNYAIYHQFVTRFPLIVLDGIPLRGIEIKTQLDKINTQFITGLNVVDYEVGLGIWGESAINGVVIIETVYK